MSVAAPSPERRPFPLDAFVRASSLHVGAAAAAAAVRLCSRAPDPWNGSTSNVRLLGERFAGWKGALGALTVGTFIPALIAVAVGAAYVGYAGKPLAQAVMQGARAGALAVLVWAIVRLGRPQLQQHRSRGVVLAFVTLVMTLLVPVPQFVILLVAGALGAAFMRTDLRERSRSVLVAAACDRAIVQRLCLRTSHPGGLCRYSRSADGRRAEQRDRDQRGLSRFLGLYVVVLGYFVAGVPGAVAGALALATPALLAIPIARAVRRHRDSQVRGACSGIVIASCVLMATTSARLAPEAARTLCSLCWWRPGLLHWLRSRAAGRRDHRLGLRRAVLDVDTHQETSRRTDSSEVGELCRNCVRSPRKHRQTATFTGSHREAFCGGKSLNRLCEEMFRCCSMRSPESFSKRAPSTTRPSLRFRINHLRS